VSDVGVDRRAALIVREPHCIVLQTRFDGWERIRAGHFAVLLIRDRAIHACQEHHVPDAEFLDGVQKRVRILLVVHLRLIAQEQHQCAVAVRHVVELVLLLIHALDVPLAQFDHRPHEVMRGRYLEQVVAPRHEPAEGPRPRVLDEVGRQAGRDVAGVRPLLPSGDQGMRLAWPVPELHKVAHQLTSRPSGRVPAAGVGHGNSPPATILAGGLRSPGHRTPRSAGSPECEGAGTGRRGSTTGGRTPHRERAPTLSRPLDGRMIARNSVDRQPA